MAKRIALIGSSGGIGKKLTELLRSKGCEIISINRSKEDPNASKNLSWNAEDPNLPPIEGPLDGLVYLPGTITLKPFSQLTDADYEKDWTINFLGAVRAIRGYLNNLKEAHAPSITLVSSVAASSGFSYHASIASAKAALEGLVRSLAAEFAPKVRVNAIAPSLCKTPLAEFLTNTPEKIDASAKRHPLARLGDPSDPAHLISFLLSEESGWITGQVFHVDGGIGALKPI